MNKEKNKRAEIYQLLLDANVNHQYYQAIASTRRITLTVSSIISDAIMLSCMIGSTAAFYNTSPVIGGVSISISILAAFAGIVLKHLEFRRQAFEFQEKAVRWNSLITFINLARRQLEEGKKSSFEAILPLLITKSDELHGADHGPRNEELWLSIEKSEAARLRMTPHEPHHDGDSGHDTTE